MIFCDTALASRLEQIEAVRIAAAAGATGFARPIGGGFAIYAEPDSPLNKVAGLGFAGVPADGDWQAVEAAFAERGTDIQVELAHLGDPAIATRLTERGYRLAGFENVLGRAVPDSAAELPIRPPGVEIRPSGDDEFEPWLDVIVEAFASPDATGQPPPESFPREVLARAVRTLTGAAGVRRYLALCDGTPAGTASVAFTGGVAAFTGAATLPAYRRRGIQTAMLAARMADAIAAGCDVATVTTSPATKSQQNAQRQGFELLYTRAVLVRRQDSQDSAGVLGVR